MIKIVHVLFFTCIWCLLCVALNWWLLGVSVFLPLNKHQLYRWGLHHYVYIACSLKRLFNRFLKPNIEIKKTLTTKQTQNNDNGFAFFPEVIKIYLIVTKIVVISRFFLKRVFKEIPISLFSSMFELGMLVCFGLFVRNVSWRSACM